MKTLSVALGLTLILSGCATTNLTDAGSKVKIIHNQAPVSCEQLGQIVGEGGYGETLFPSYKAAKADMLNRAGDLGANYVLLQQYDEKKSHSRYYGIALKCDNTVGLNEADLKLLCDQNNSSACFDLAGIQVNKSHNPVDGDENLDKACKLGQKQACATQIKYGRDSQTKLAMKTLNNKCDAGKATSCLALAFQLKKYNYTTLAIEHAQKACSKGNKEGCEFYKRLMDERATNTNAAGEQQSNSTDLQTLLLIKSMNEKSNDNMVNAVRGLSDDVNKKEPARPKQNCVTRKRPSAISGETILDTECE